MGENGEEGDTSNNAAAVVVVKGPLEKKRANTLRQGKHAATVAIAAAAAAAANNGSSGEENHGAAAAVEEEEEEQEAVEQDDETRTKVYNENTQIKSGGGGGGGGGIRSIIDPPRKQYSVKVKKSVVAQVDKEMREGNTKGAFTVVAKLRGISRSLVSKWYKDREILESSSEKILARLRLKRKAGDGEAEDDDHDEDRVEPPPPSAVVVAAAAAAMASANARKSSAQDENKVHSGQHNRNHGEEEEEEDNDDEDVDDDAQQQQQDDDDDDEDDEREFDEDVGTETRKFRKTKASSSSASESKKAFRKQYSLEFKKSVVEDCDAYTKKGDVKNVITTVARNHGVDRSIVSKWYKDREQIEAKISGREPNSSTSVFRARVKKARYPLAEDEVLEKYNNLKEQQKTPDAKTLKLWMAEACNKHYGSNLTDGFNASNGWLNRFKVRHGLIKKRKADDMSYSLDERITVLRRFHQRISVRASFREEEQQQSDPVFGRFSPKNRMCFDLLPFKIYKGDNKTVEIKGTEFAHNRGKVISKPGERLATIQLGFVFSRVEQQPPPCIIFRGNGSAYEEEKDLYDSRVVVAFNPSGSATTSFMEGEFSKKILEPYVEKIGEPNHPKLLFLDKSRYPPLKSLQATYEKLNVKVQYFPRGSAEFIQPLEQGVGSSVKQRMNMLLQDMIHNNPQFREAWNDGYSPKDTRILVTRLVAEAWAHVTDTFDFEKLGYTTGCVIPKISVDPASLGEDKQVKIRGSDTYSWYDPDELKNLLSGYKSSTEENQDGEEEDDDDDEEEDNLSDEEFNHRENASVLDDSLYQHELEDGIIPDVGHKVFPAPENFSVEYECPQDISLMTVQGRRVLWIAPTTKNSVPGWICGQIKFRRPEITERLRGITYYIVCNKSLDENSPQELMKADLPVAFTRENYGKRWFLLKEQHPPTSI